MVAISNELDKEYRNNAVLIFMPNLHNPRPRHHKTRQELERHKFIRSITSQYQNAVSLINKQSYYDYCYFTNKNIQNQNIDDDGVLSSKGDDLQPLIDDICLDIETWHNIDRSVVLSDLRQISNNHKQKQFRNNKKVAFLLSSPCVFLTLTWNDKTLEETNETTRRRYVRQYLNSLGCYYLGNIDYGKETHREHYHAIVQLSSVDLDEWSRLHDSYIFSKKVRCDKVSSNNLTRYILKLSNHSVKTSTENKRVLTNIPKELL